MMENLGGRKGLKNLKEALDFFGRTPRPLSSNSDWHDAVDTRPLYRFAHIYIAGRRLESASHISGSG